MNLAQLLTDEKAAHGGKWIEYGNGVSFLLGAANNPAHQKAMAKVASKRARAQRVMDTAAAEELFISTLPGTVLLGWKGLTTGRPAGTNGSEDPGEEKEFPYTLENAATLLSQSMPIRQFVQVEAANADNFAMESEAATAATLKSES